MRPLEKERQKYWFAVTKERVRTRKLNVDVVKIGEHASILRVSALVVARKFPLHLLVWIPIPRLLYVSV